MTSIAMVTSISIKYTSPKTLVYPSKSVHFDLLYYVLVHCDLYLKLESVTTEKSNRATLNDYKWSENTNRFSLYPFYSRKWRGGEAGAYSREALTYYFGRGVWGWGRGMLIRWRVLIRAWALTRGNTVFEDYEQNLITLSKNGYNSLPISPHD